MYFSLFLTCRICSVVGASAHTDSVCGLLFVSWCPSEYWVKSSASHCSATDISDVIAGDELTLCVLLKISARSVLMYVLHLASVKPGFHVVIKLIRCLRVNLYVQFKSWFWRKVQLK